MSTSVGAIHYDLALDKSRFDGGAADVHSQLGGLASKALGVAKQITIAFGAMAVAATGFAVKGAADFEQTRIGLENMLGSADQARSLLQDISTFAAQTPFEFPELAKSTRMLIAFGFSATDGYKAMQTLGDVSAAVGANLEDLSYLYGTLRAQGRAYTVDIKQFATRGIPIYKYLAEVLGVAEDKVMGLVEAGKVGFPEVEKAFQKMTAAGGQFHGAMESQSKSLSGQFSTLKDNIGFAARELVGINQQGDIREGSVFSLLRDSVGALNRELGKIKWADVNASIMAFGKQIYDAALPVALYLLPKLQDLWSSISVNLIPALLKFWHEVIEPLMPVLGILLVGAVGLAIDALKIVTGVLSGLIDFMANNEGVVYGIATAFGVFAGLKAVGAAILALHTLTYTTIPAAIGGLGALGTSLMVFSGWGVFAAAALGAFALIMNEAQKTVNTLNDMYNSIDRQHASNDAALRRANEQFKAGKITKERMNAILRSTLPGNAMGTDNWRGGPTWVGERGPEIVNLPRGAQVIPNHKTGGGANITINMDGIMARSRADLRDIGKDIIGAINEELRAKNMAQIGGGAI
jgi:hypothetical protein